MNVQHHDDPWKKILQPSQFSIIVTILLILCFATGTVYFLFVYSSQLGEFLKIGLESQAASNSNNLESVQKTVDSSEFAANASVFAFWFFIGGMCYLAATSLWHTFVAARWDLDSVVTESYSGRFETLVEIIARLGLRAVGLTLLIASYFATFYLVPWFLLWLYQLSSQSLSIIDAVVVVVTVGLVALISYVLMLGARLLTLRIRLFTQ